MYINIYNVWILTIKYNVCSSTDSLWLFQGSSYTMSLRYDSTQLISIVSIWKNVVQNYQQKKVKERFKKLKRCKMSREVKAGPILCKLQEWWDILALASRMEIAGVPSHILLPPTSIYFSGFQVCWWQGSAALRCNSFLGALSGHRDLYDDDT